MNERRRTLSNTAYSTLGLYAEYLLGLVASILVARELGPADLGIYGLVVWIVATAVVVANAGITTAAIKFVAELRGGGHEALVPALVQRLRFLQRVMLGVVLAGVALLYLGAGTRLMPGVDTGLFALLLAAIALRAPYMFNIAVAKGAQDFRGTALVAGVGAVSNLLLVAIAFARGAALQVFIAIYAVSSAVFWLVSRQRAARILGPAPAGRATLPVELERRVRHHLRVVAVTIVLSSIGASEIELLFLTLHGDPAAAGLFKVANALALGAALLVPGVVGLQLLPLMANAYGQGPQVAARRISTATAWLFLLGAPLVAFGAVYSARLIELLYGPAFAAAAPALAGLLVARVASTLGQGASAYMVSADRQTSMMVLTLIFSVLRFTGAWISIRYHGLAGAVAAAAVLAVLGSGSTIALALRETRSSLPWGRLLRTALAAALVALCAWPLARIEPALLALAAGGLVFVVLYPAAVLLLRCMSDDEREFAQGLAARLGGDRLAARWRRPRS